MCTNKNSLNVKTQAHLIDDLVGCDFGELTNGFEVVIHLAALVHQPNQTDVGAYMQLNYDMTVALFKTVADNEESQFITLSTSHVHEGLQDEFEVERGLFPVSIYAK